VEAGTVKIGVTERGDAGLNLVWLEALKRGVVDARQRKYCCCVTEKKELFASREPCAHACLYCYWKD
jgi:hypothetical protein